VIRTIKIKKKIWYTRSVFGLEFYLPEINPLPGQFFQLTVNDTLDPFLNRPISVASYKRSSLLFIIKIVGKGTKLLSERKVGEELQLSGPFGNGVKPKHKKIILFAGGIGVAPLYFLAECLKKRKIDFSFLCGTKTPEEIILRRDIKNIANKSIFVCEKGTRKNATVISEIKELDLSEYEVAYSCGPREMLIELKKLDLPLKVYAFCEDFLGCGCGLCLGCAIKYRGQYKRICVDGPVFELKDIEFN
jgi:dihydroorotate dehydrogenase electron transfer subunit